MPVPLVVEQHGIALALSLAVLSLVLSSFPSLSLSPKLALAVGMPALSLSEQFVPNHLWSYQVHRIY